MLASGWGKAWVGEYGIVNMIWRGMPSFSAQWIWAKLGGLAMMQSATKGLAAGSEPGSFSGARKGHHR